MPLLSQNFEGEVSWAGKYAEADIAGATKLLCPAQRLVVATVGLDMFHLLTLCWASMPDVAGMVAQGKPASGITE